MECFRDEDLRADRQPEFTQIDIETSFLEPKDIQAMMEEMIKSLWKELKNVELPDFPVLTWDEAMSKYGSDKPDLRIPMEIRDIAQIVKDCEFTVFKGPANDPKGRVAALRVPGGAVCSRKQIDEVGRVVGVNICEVADIDYMMSFTTNDVINAIGTYCLFVWFFIFVGSPLENQISL